MSSPVPVIVPAAIRVDIAVTDALDDVMATMDAAFDPAFGEAWTRPQCEGILGLPGVWLMIARLTDEPASTATAAAPNVGFALARVIVDEAELLLIAVPPAARRIGAGATLLDAVAATARQRGARRLHLEMREGNPARALYDAAGFAEVGRRRGYYRGHDGRRFDAITLSCELATTKSHPSTSNET